MTIKIIKNFFKFLLLAGFIYALITHFMYTLGAVLLFIILTAILVRHSFLFLNDSKNDEFLNNLFKKAAISNNSEIARSVFKWNIVGRYILKTLLDKQLVREYNNVNIEKCLKYLNIDNELTEKVIKKAWKDQAKIFHPDKFQDEIDKLKANKRFNQLTDCKNKLLNYLKDVNV